MILRLLVELIFVHVFVSNLISVSIYAIIWRHKKVQKFKMAESTWLIYLVKQAEHHLRKKRICLQFQNFRLLKQGIVVSFTYYWPLLWILSPKRILTTYGSVSLMYQRTYRSAWTNPNAKAIIFARKNFSGGRGLKKEPNFAKTWHPVTPIPPPSSLGINIPFWHL